MRMLLAATGLACALSLAGSWPAVSADMPKVSAPVVHDNLAVYFLRGPSAPGPVPLTLKEAMASGHVVVRETGSVQRLEIANAGHLPVFVQAGDIVKGGRQDRVLAVSLLVPAHSGPMPIGAYCVEQGRWQKRGLERADQFASSDNYLPSRRAKTALAASAFVEASPADARSPRSHNGRSLAAGHPTGIVQNRIEPYPVGGTPRAVPPRAVGQSEVWASVAEVQRKLSANVGTRVSSEKSASSLQLALEHETLAKARQAYVDAILTKAVGDDIVGVVIAINGKVSSGEVYPSHGLFKKMWPKLAEAAAIEAIGEVTKTAAAPQAAPTSAEVSAFIASADAAKPKADTIATSLKREARQTEKAMAISTVLASGALLHRSYLAK